TVKPGGANVIPEMVEFTLDLRDVELARRDERLFEVKEKIEQICHQRGLSFEMTKLLLQKPVSCADHITLTMEQKAQALGLNPVKLISGAGHDAMSLNEMTDVGMIFVRSRGGISHNPREWSDWEDISLGTALLAETALEYLK
ncbi:MAG: M20/M25/M40 family metallo-hydrolase, partial [Bacillus sp. (in: firmicutes)]